MSYGSLPAQSRKADSMRSKMSLRTFTNKLMPVWQRVLQVLPLKRAEEDYEELGSPSSIYSNTGQDAREDYTMSGALPNDHICQDHPHLEPCVTGSCSGGAQNRSNAIQYDKPLPPRPRMPSGSDFLTNRASYMSAIANFSIDIDNRFNMEETERKILRCLRQLSNMSPNPSDPSLVTVRVGEVEWAMSKEDAQTLQRIHSMTAPLSADVKADLLKNLDHLIIGNQRYPFEQIVADRFRIIPKTSGNPSIDKNDGEGEGSGNSHMPGIPMESEPTDDMTPAPLRIRKPPRMPVPPLSPLTEGVEVTTQTDTFKRPGSVSKVRANMMNVPETSLTVEQHDTTPLDMPHEAEYIPALPERSSLRTLRRVSSAPYGNLSQRQAGDFATPDVTSGSLEQIVPSPKQQGSVARARYDLYQVQRLARAESDNHMLFRPQADPLEEPQHFSRFHNPRTNMYMSPRQAPAPPAGTSASLRRRSSHNSDPYLIPISPPRVSRTQEPVIQRRDFWDRTVARLKRSASARFVGLGDTQQITRGQRDMTREPQSYPPVTRTFHQAPFVLPNVANEQRSTARYVTYGDLRGGGREINSAHPTMSRRLTRRVSTMFRRLRVDGSERPTSGPWIDGDAH